MSRRVELGRRLDARQRWKGEQVFAEGRVRIRVHGAERVEASVQGESTYAVVLHRARGRWSMSCDCPAFEGQAACKHVWAVVLAAEAEEARDGPTPDADVLDVPPGRVSSRPLPADSAGAVPARAAPLPRGVGARRARAASGGPATVQVSGPEALRYVLRVLRREPESWTVLATEIRGPATGRSNEWRLARPRPADVARLPVDDQRVLAMVPPSPWSWRVEEVGLGAGEIPAVLEQPVLELAAGTGRLHFVDGAGRRVGPLARDPGEAWSFEIELGRDRGQIVATGRLVRGAEALDLGACAVALAGGLIVCDTTLARADWRGAWAWASLLHRQRALRWPAGEERRLLALLEALPPGFVVRSDALAEDAPAVPTGVLLLERFLLPDGTIPAEIVCAYGDERCDLRDRRTVSYVQRAGRTVRVRRDFEAEARFVQEFERAGGAWVRDEIEPFEDVDDVEDPDEDPVEDDPRPVVHADRLPDLVRALAAAGWTVEADGSRLRAESTPRAHVSSGVDWFDLRTTIDFDGLSPELPELLRAARENRRFVRLSDGSTGLVPERWLARLRLAAAIGREVDGALRVPGSRAWLLDALLAEQDGALDVDAAFERVRTNLRRCAEPAERREPAGFRGELRSYQREGLGWMHFLSAASLGGILADDMGLGKTVQLLALVVERRARARGPALVAAPLSVLFHWESEARRFAPDLACVRHHGSQRARTAASLEDADLVLTSHATLRLDVDLLRAIRFDCAVIDEAQAIKNEKSQVAKAARLLQADARFALSGTPVENHLGELVSILRFANPELLEGSAQLAELLARGKADPETATLLARAVRPFLLRRTKEVVAPELPAKTETVVRVELEGAARREYDALRKRVAAQILGLEAELGLERIGIHVLTALLRLRQAACHPGLVDPARAGEGSAKLDLLLERLAEIAASGHKALVFSQFTSFLAIVRSRLDERGLRHEYLDGATDDRAARVRSFQTDPSVPLFLISLKAGGFGLNLTAADYVFLLDPWWNPAVEAQAIDRAHRIGRTRPVAAYRLIARDTIEERVLELQESKRALADALFAEAGTSLRDLSREDLARLFS